MQDENTTKFNGEAKNRFRNDFEWRYHIRALVRLWREEQRRALGTNGFASASAVATASGQA